MQSSRAEHISKMIATSLDLETLVIEGVPSKYWYMFASHPLEQWFCTSCPQLTSLTLSGIIMQMDGIQSALSQTPSLRHLKIVADSFDIIDGYKWEDFIKTKLPALNISSSSTYI
jgi:hypothetical protein